MCQAPRILLVSCMHLVNTVPHLRWCTKFSYGFREALDMYHRLQRDHEHVSYNKDVIVATLLALMGTPVSFCILCIAHECRRMNFGCALALW